MKYLALALLLPFAANAQSVLGQPNVVISNSIQRTTTISNGAIIVTADQKVIFNWPLVQSCAAQQNPVCVAVLAARGK